MGVSKVSVLAAMAGLMVSGVGRADDRYDRDELERYRAAMDRIWDNAFDSDSGESSDKYAAIAYSPSTGKYGYSYNYTSQAGAQRRALAQLNANDAKLVAWSRNSYCALAKGKDNSYGAAYGTTASQARSRALSECQKHSKECSIVVCVYSGE
jgi:serine/threonine-protein kinase